MRKLKVIVLTGCAWATTAQANAQGTLRDTLQNFIKTGQAVRSAAPELRNPVSIDYGIKELELSRDVLDAYKTEPLARLLAQQLPVFVRTYGVNGPANLTLRGASAAQTSVRWNGVPLQNGATGLVDLLLIPVGIVDEVSIRYGSTAGVNGSGAVGGTLELNNERAAFKDHREYSASLSGGVGSFGSYRAAAKLQGSSKAWTGGVSAVYSKADNDFQYTDLSGREQRLSHGHFESLNVLGTVEHKINQRSSVSANIWGGKNQRQIPPALFESASVKDQEDAYLRSSVNYRYAVSRNTEVYTTVSLMDEWFRYQDTAAAIRTDASTRQWYAAPGINMELPHTNLLSRLSLIISAPLQWNHFPGEPDKAIKRGALAGQLQGVAGGSSFNANGRAEIINGRLYGAGGLNASVRLHARFAVRGSAGYTYRTPTLNELYYTPGGNRDLLPEQGYNGEVGYSWGNFKDKPGLYFAHSATGFYRNISNWIIWYGGAVWTPHNIARVLSTGIETENRLLWKRPKLNWELRAKGAWISSQTTESVIANDGSVGRQIPYAPRLISQGSISVYARRWRMSYSQTYTGIRYYNTDETGELDAYTLGTVLAGYSWERGQWTAALSLQLNNIWNQRYIEVSGRPAPGVNWLFGLTLTRKEQRRN